MQNTAAGGKEPVYTKMTQEQLNEAVDLHNRFMEGRVGGKRAILRRADISGLSA